MMTKGRLDSHGNLTANRLGRVSSLISAVILAASATALADVPDPPPGRFGGIYKVTSSTDPLFPATQTREYFLDFGRGIQADKLSGNVAVSVRQNPNVKVRIMAWQYFPDQGRIVIGNAYAEGSRNAVVKGAWRMRAISSGVIFERGNYQVILQPADPMDY